MTKEYVDLAKQGYNPLTSMHFKKLKRSVRVDLYEEHYRKRYR